MAKKINNLKEKLSFSRELCIPNLSERLHIFADYMSAIISDSPITPDGLAFYLETAMKDLQQHNWQGKTESRILQEHLLFDAKRIRNQICNFPLIIDALSSADSSFAQEFRAICMERYGFNPLPYGTEQEYPEYVKVAVEWWLNIFGSSKSYSNKELQLFRTTIAQEITEDIMAWELCNLSIGYLPCEAIQMAIKTLGIPNISPTTMIIQKHCVQIKTNGYTEILWEA